MSLLKLEDLQPNLHASDLQFHFPIQSNHHIEQNKKFNKMNNSSSIRKEATCMIKQLIIRLLNFPSLMAQLPKKGKENQ